MQTIKIVKESGEYKRGEIVTVENNEAFRLVDSSIAVKYNPNDFVKSTFNKMMPAKQIRKKEIY